MPSSRATETRFQCSMGLTRNCLHITRCIFHFVDQGGDGGLDCAIIGRDSNYSMLESGVDTLSHNVNSRYTFIVFRIVKFNMILQDDGSWKRGGINKCIQCIHPVASHLIALRTDGQQSSHR